MIIMLTLGLLPALILLWVIYRQDKIEREPFRLLLRLFLFGCLTTISAYILETIGERILSCFFDYRNDWYNLWMYFVVVGLAEEGSKYFALRKGSWKDVNFNYRFDGVVYAVAVSLGFAAAENIAYIFSFGTQVIGIRALTAIPLHCITGVYMGHYYGQAKHAEARCEQNRMKAYKKLALLMPVLIHGFYDFAASSENVLFSLLFFVYVAVLDVIAIISVKKYARQDAPV